MAQSREDWVKKVVGTGLNVSEHELEELLNGDRESQMLLQFLEKSKQGTALLFYTVPVASKATSSSGFPAHLR